MKRTKHPKKPPEIVYTVGRFLFAFYDDKRMSYGYHQTLGVSSQVIREVKQDMGLMDSPKGFSGGPIEDKAAVVEFLTQLLSHSRALGSRFDPEKLKIKVRYHVMHNDTITCDMPPDNPRGEPNYKLNQGYKSLELAQSAAQAFFNYYEKWLRDTKNKPIQPVKLVLHNKEGEITIRKSNNYKP